MLPPERRRRRNSLRLSGWDYRTCAAYFVTVCVQGGHCLFDNQDYRVLAEECWSAIPDHFPNVELDAFVVMPNHVHGIIGIVYDVGAPPSPKEGPADSRRARGSVGAIVGAFKSAVAKRLNEMRGTPGASLWQRGYYDHIIRNDRSLEAIRRYIEDNPRNWLRDPENPTRGEEV